MPLSNPKLAILALIAANVIWGAAFPIYKWTIEVVPLFIFIFLRFFLGALILLPFVIKDHKIRSEDMIKVGILGLLGISIQIPLLFMGLQLSPSINAPIIISSGPIILIIASFLFLHERIKRKVVIGTAISLLGVLLIILGPVLEHGFTGSILGNLFFFLATICGVGQALVMRQVSQQNSPLAITFWSFLLGSISLGILAFSELPGFDIGSIGIQGILGIIYGVVFAGVLAHVFLTYAIKYIKASEAGIFAYVDPLATILVAVPLLGEKITLTYIIASIFIFAGIFIAEKRLNYHPLQLFGRVKNLILILLP